MDCTTNPQQLPLVQYHTDCTLQDAIQPPGTQEVLPAVQFVLKDSTCEASCPCCDVSALMPC